MIYLNSSKFESKSNSNSIGDYLIGFAISSVLTAISFALALYGSLSIGVLSTALSVLAFIQIIIHLIYFLHMNRSSDRSWNIMALIYILLTGLILIFGTIWIMYNARMNMMQ
ncbi:MAG: cytochrome o ubiquinol oxidase subunit IV [Burkholderia sp.]|nr:cytochrome o ubiquinol oxidase subunit IV [Burkholderia sp.]